MLHSIPALARAEMTRVGYAVEYDYVLTDQTRVSLECKTVPGLFFAGQINGTTGYEEAAAQGLIAGINAARRAKSADALILRRDEAYIGVMLDDLVTQEFREPYRLFTSRAEYRLLLRHDNADLRLSPIGRRIGLIDAERSQRVEARRGRIDAEIARLRRNHISLTSAVRARAEALGLGSIAHSMSAAELLQRPAADYAALVHLGAGDEALPADVAATVEIELKYSGYLDRQANEVARIRRHEEQTLPNDFNYDDLRGLRTEARQVLTRFRPSTIGQAGRLAGVTPADVAILLIQLERQRVRA
jgi:tRNA uridine 5-carboxymethylaminomethyl modification enzyme